LSFYGRGPVENYCDRNNNSVLGIYNQDVATQYWGYIRPQESGNKTDIRWWKVMNEDGSGLCFYGFKPMECSTLNYLTSDLDDGLEKHQHHSGDLTPRPFSVVHISDRQMGVGGITSWGTWPLKKYRIPYENQNFSFVISPL
jgi:beta-galactosidase